MATELRAITALVVQDILITTVPYYCIMLNTRELMEESGSSGSILSGAHEPPKAAHALLLLF